ncbi:MAG: hypothetical protein HYX32_00310 [Actinobacteria bacterium]|nr:hypothetical protein [Actinomycetota bacterium]
MRLLQIDPNGSETTALDFHPMVTIVTGLTPSGRDIVLRVARSLAKAQDPGYGGLLEAHGVLLDLSRETLELLDLQTDFDVLIAEDDLPRGAPLPPETAEDVEAAPAAELSEAARGYDDVEAFIESAPVGLSDEFDQARRRRADAREALGILREAAAKSQAEFDKVLAKQKMAEAEFAAVRESRPLLRLVVGEEAEDGEPAEPQIDPREIIRQRNELALKVEQLEGRITTMVRGLEELSAIDTRPLTVLLDAIRNPQPIEYVPSDRAHELADEVIDLERKVAELEKDLDKRGLASGLALKQLEIARNELANAEKAMRKPELTADDISALEAAHEEVLEAETKASGAFKRGGQKRLEQALARQQEILDHIGFPTWSAYVMGAGLLAIDHAAEQRLDKARLDMDAAENHWASVCAEIESNPEHRQLLDRLEDVYLEAFDLLGGTEPEDLEGALRELQVPKREVTSEELVDALAYQLELAGLQLPEGASADLTVVAADAFLEEASAVEGRIAEIRDERATAEAELAVARGQLNELALVELPELDETELSIDDAFDPSDPFGLGDVQAGERAPTEMGPRGEAEQQRGLGTAGDPFDVGAIAAGDAGGALFGGLAEEQDEPDLERLERAVDDAVEEVAEYTEWVESREALVDAALTIEAVATTRLLKIASELMDQTDANAPASVGGNGDSAGGTASSGGSPGGSNGSAARTGPPRVEDIEQFLVDRSETHCHVSYAGSLPIVLNDTFAHLRSDDARRLLDQLRMMSEAVQVIYLTDDGGIAGWAEEVGFQRAAVVPAPIGFG